jgi:hypothetical protein
VLKPVRFRDDGIEFPEYPYPGAAVFPSGVVADADIRDVDPWCAPPEVRLKSGEVLFVSAVQRDELERVARERSIPVVRRLDVWGLVLEPFLDTEFGPDHRERTLAQLEASGVSRREATRLRRRLGLRMLAYNALHWDWAHLGLCDVLDASLPRGWLPFSRRRFERFYRSAMALAERGRRLEGPSTDAAGTSLERIREVAWRDPWEAVPEPAGAGLVRELRAELGAAHVLAGRPAAAIARRRDRDDVLFLVREPTQLAVVHLTWTREANSASKWPGTELFSSVEEFLGRCADD